jgi:hypothetical protein
MAAHKENPPSVDELYGLEPVIEPGDGEAAGNGSGDLQPWTVQCPYCGESFDTTIDLSAGSTSYIEDCQVCCQPMEFTVEVADDGTLASLKARRGD